MERIKKECIKKDQVSFVPFAVQRNSGPSLTRRMKEDPRGLDDTARSEKGDGNVRWNKDGLILAEWWREIRAKVFN